MKFFDRSTSRREIFGQGTFRHSGWGPSQFCETVLRAPERNIRKPKIYEKQDNRCENRQIPEHVLSADYKMMFR